MCGVVLQIIIDLVLHVVCRVVCCLFGVVLTLLFELHAAILANRLCYSYRPTNIELLIVCDVFLIILR